MRIIFKLKEILLVLLFFFCISFNTVYLGPKSLRLNPSRILFLLLVIVSLVSIIVNRGRIIYSRSKHRKIVTIALLYIIYGYIISLAESIDLSISYRYIFELVFFVIVFAALSSVSREDNKIYEKCISAYILGVLVNNIIAWYELITSNYLFLVSEERIPFYIRHNYALTFYANPNNLCTVLALGCLFCFIRIGTLKTKKMKAAFVFIITSSILIMIRNNSEANIIGLLIGVVIIHIMRRINKTSLKPIHFVIIALGVVAIAFSIDKLLPMLVSYIERTNSMIGVEDSTIGTRIEYSKSAISNMLNKSILGVGLGNSKYYSLGIIGEVGNVHNWFTEILVDTGVFVFAIYIYYYFKTVIIAYKKSRIIDNSPSISLMYIGCVSIMVSFLVINISSSSLFPSDYIWCIWAFLFSVVYTDKQVIKNDDKEVKKYG